MGFGLLTARGKIIVKQVYYDWIWMDTCSNFGIVQANFNMSTGINMKICTSK